METDIIVRTLTLVIQFDEKHPPDWIWECHKHRSFANGFFIATISEGNQIKSDDEES